jgi:hypothetical protein
MKTKKYLYIITFVLVMLAFFSWVIFKTNNDNESLRKNKTQTIGIVTDVDLFPRGDGLYVFYEFKLADNLYKNKTRIFIGHADLNFTKTILIHKTLPIIYDNKNIDNNILLLSKKDFESFEEQRSDSLRRLYNQIDSLWLK